MSDVVIRVENISKLYRLGEVGTGSLAHDVNRWWHRVRGKEDPYLKIGEVNDRTKSVSSVQRPESSAKNANALDPRRSSLVSSAPAPDSRPSSLVTPKAPPSDWVYALKDVSFEVKRGEVLGIIGRNGAGKSTLLKILSRVTTQSEGQIKVKGRIASLLEVGTGFHPELTGRENIFLNGAILGMRKAEIARKFDEIVEFSGCARYIDTPVKRYSSGMYVRLAFAVAAHLEPEILIVDEVLAVGDAEFQKKCLGKMKDVAGHGRTILFVSHNMASLSNLCTRGIIIKNGLISFDSDIQSALEKYSISLAERPRLDFQDQVSKHIISVNIFNDKNEKRENIIYPDNHVAITIKTKLNDKTKLINKIGIGIDDTLGQRVTTVGTYFSNNINKNVEFDGNILCRIPRLPLVPGFYSLKIALGNEFGDFESVENALSFEVLSSDFYGTGKTPEALQGKILTTSIWYM